MDRAAIQELFEYTGWAWERIERVIDGLPEATFEKAVEGSGWPSLRECFSHFTAAYDGWLNSKEWGLGLAESMVYTGLESFDTWEKAKVYRRKVRESWLAAMDAPDEVVFRKEERNFGDSHGAEVISRGDILANLVIHERGHHGDLNTLFHQLGVKSYYIDYRFYVIRRDHFDMDEGDEG